MNNVGDMWQDMQTNRAWLYKEDHWHYVGIVPEGGHIMQMIVYAGIPCSDECKGEYATQLKRVSDWDKWMQTVNSEKIVNENYDWDEDLDKCVTDCHDLEENNEQ
jgi:hypothetical protein